MHLLRLLGGLTLLSSVSAHQGHDHHDHSDHSDHVDHSHDSNPAIPVPVKASEEDFTPPTPVALPEIPQDLLSRIDFLETFQGAVLEKGWVPSKNERYFSSEWRIATRFKALDLAAVPRYSGFENDKSLGMIVKHQHYGISHVLEKPFENENKTMVFQYEVRLHENALSCSGAYAKLLLKDESYNPSLMEEATPYVVMFGPDKCGNTNKVHFIVRQRMGKANKWEEKHMTHQVSALTSDSLTHLYTLVIRPDNTFSVLVDNVEQASGSMLSPTDFSPPFGAAKEVDDPNDTKPKDWVDAVKITDPTAIKPEDWDETLSKTIDDPDAQKPTDWLEKDDGDWAPSQIPNPAFKGKWNAPIIENPDYKGEWKPRRISNPEFFEDEHPSYLAPIGAVSFEVLANERGIAFDNILLTHDEQAAMEFAKLTFKPKQVLEAAQEEHHRKLKEKADRLRAWDEGGPYGRVTYMAGELLEFVKDNLVAIVVSVLVVFGACIYFMCIVEGENYRVDKKEKKTATKPSIVENMGESENEDSEDEEPVAAAVPPKTQEAKKDE